MGSLGLFAARYVDVAATGVLGQVSSAYVHIPFCRQQCRYCDFPIDVAGARFSERSRRYVDCIIKEIQELCRGRRGALRVFKP